jgi:hypothetical protein
MPVGSPTDNKYDAEALPDAELNPLLNPLLAAHMGRWAEVYFTTPPEKRAQAVSDLLQELRRNSPTESATVQRKAKEKEKQEEEIAAAELPRQAAPAIAEVRQTCSACDADNPSNQRFCGMCGAPLQGLPQTDDSRFQASEPAAEEARSQTEAVTSGNVEEYSAEPSLSFGGYARHDATEPEWSIPDADLPQFAVEQVSVPYRYRLYIGIALALLLAVLVYMGWHGTKGSSGDTSGSRAARVMPAVPPAAPPVATQEPAARTVLPTESPAAAPSAPPAVSNNQSEGRSRLDQTRKDQPARAPATTPRVVPVANSMSSEAGGAEELAAAENYLNGSDRGNKAEAAQWLWKAVGKGNVTATMVLSDMYLRGDGVPKSCDQARLLLHVAARKGKTSAGERLRNLQAFGCQ